MATPVAEARATALLEIATLIAREAPDELVMMNSRYDFVLSRTPEGWRISRLVLAVGWFEKRHFAQPEGGIRTVPSGNG